MQEFEIIAKTFQGLEEVLAQEITELGGNNVQIGLRMVSFTGTQEMLYRANFCLRTAVRVLKPVKHFTAADADDVYNAVKAIEWSEIFSADQTFAVDSVVFSQEFRHSKFVAYRVKDAIADHFRERTGSRPNISLTKPDIRINIHIAEEECTLSLDSSGESLHLRGYRAGAGDAPINEVLAAGLIKLSGWTGQTDFYDPFCGSGTIAIEAALMARNIYPGIFREAYAFEKWNDFKPELLEAIYNDDSQERPFDHKIYAFDINRPVLDIALQNAKNAGVADLIEFRQQDIRDFQQPEGPAVMVTNPPYGQRLRTDDIETLYRTIGERLKHAFRGGEAWIISSREELFDAIGLRPSTRVELLNGNLDCDFRKYQIFEGKMDKFLASGGEVKSVEDRRRNTDKRRFKTSRGEFRRPKPATERTEEETLLLNMQSKHREFERNFGWLMRGDGERRKPAYSRWRQNDTADSETNEPRENRFDRREKRFDNRDGRFGDREKRFGDNRERRSRNGKDFGPRKPGFGGKRNDTDNRTPGGPKGGRFTPRGGAKPYGRPNGPDHPKRDN